MTRSHSESNHTPESELFFPKRVRRFYSWLIMLQNQYYWEFTMRDVYCWWFYEWDLTFNSQNKTKRGRLLQFLLFNKRNYHFHCLFLGNFEILPHLSQRFGKIYLFLYEKKKKKKGTGKRWDMPRSVGEKEAVTYVLFFLSFPFSVSCFWDSFSLYSDDLEFVVCPSLPSAGSDSRKNATSYGSSVLYNHWN